MMVLYDLVSGEVLGLSTVSDHHGPAPPQPSMANALGERGSMKGVGCVNARDDPDMVQEPQDYKVILEGGRPKGLGRRTGRCRLEFGCDRPRDRFGSVPMKADGKDSVRMSLRALGGPSGDAPQDGRLTIFMTGGRVDRTVIETSGGSAEISIIAPRDTAVFSMTATMDGARPLTVWFRAEP